ncbi:MAG TPA: hypothetical protein PLR88_02820 [Bacteroidales bacterium]|nr:hypothetical protein [Bacteroidales bacterium]HPT20854.1 hypothetical protein [Bacteroidales bacterium]
MIEYYKHNEIDKEQWDNCVKNSPGVKPYAFSWYLDIMSPGWEALVDDDYDSVFPVPCFRKFGMQYIATPNFLQQLGAFSPDKPEVNAAAEFFDYMPDLYWLIDLCIAQKIDADGYKVTARVNFELDLEKPYEILWNNFSHHCKKNIESGEKNQPVLTSDITPKELIDLFLVNRGKELKGIKPRDYQRLNNLMDFCLKNNKGRIVGVKDEGERLIFGIFIVEIEGRKTLLFVVNTPESRAKRINYYVVNEIIKEYSSTKTILDFAGSSIISIASFMESFGCITVPYYRVYRNRLFWPVRMFK